MVEPDITATASYSTKETGYYLGFSESYVRRLIKNGRLNATKPGGGQHRIRGSEINRLLEGLATEGRVPPNTHDNIPDEIHVSDAAAQQIFNSSPPPGQDISPPDQQVSGDEDASIYEIMQRKYGET